MKVVDAHADYIRSYIIEQLHKVGYYDTDNKSVRELKQKLAIARELKTDEERTNL